MVWASLPALSRTAGSSCYDCRENREDRMKSFLAACIAAIIIAGIAGYILNDLQKPVDQAFTTTSVRL
jgi:hypothetical protein